LDLRKFLDITPWCKKGNSWMGLKRKSAKIIAIIIITLAVLMAFPPFIPSPDDLINIVLAKALIKSFPDVNPLIMTGITYTVIPFILLLIGLWIYPYNTRSLFNGKVNAVQKWIRNKKPTQILLLIILSAIILYVYYKYLITGGLLEQIITKI